MHGRISVIGRYADYFSGRNGKSILLVSELRRHFSLKFKHMGLKKCISTAFTDAD